MADEFDNESSGVADKFLKARDLLSEAERIFKAETTSEHRTQWPNVYRLEGATAYAQQVLATADPRVNSESDAAELLGSAQQARDAIRAAVDSGGGDLIGSANRLLGATSQIKPGSMSPDVPRLAEIREEIRSTKAQVESQISDAGAEVSGQKDQAFAAINEAVQAIDERREAAEQQASELGLMTSSIAATNLAEGYADAAQRTEKQTNNYTVSSLVIGVLSVAVTIVGLLTVKEPSSFQTVIAHAAFGIPVALLAAYVNSLASTHRHEAWRLRHIELQIKTANPFLGLLNTERHEETLAALALGFFPGQEGVSFNGKGTAQATPELIEMVLRVLRQPQGSPTASALPTPAPPASA